MKWKTLKKWKFVKVVQRFSVSQEKVNKPIFWTNSQLNFTLHCCICFMIKSKRHMSAIKLSSKIFTIILLWSIQLKEIQYNRKQVPYLYLQEPSARCVLHETFVFLGHTVKSKDKSQVILVNWKMGLPVETIFFFLVIVFTVLCFLFETRWQQLLMALVSAWAVPAR